MAVSILVQHNYRNAVNKSGRYPVHIYVKPDNQREALYPVRLPLNPSVSEWQCKDDAWVKPSNPYYFEINDAIRAQKNKIIDLHRRLLQQGVTLTHYHIHKELEFKGDRVIFNDYFKAYMKNPPEKVVLTAVTWEKYDGFIKHLDKFNPRIAFNQIDEDMVARIRNFMAVQKGKKDKVLAPATVKSYFDKFAVVLKHAAKKDKLIDEKLVASFFEEIKVAVPERDEALQLDVHEIKAIREVKTDPQYPSQDRDRKLFLLQIYGSWYYNDLQELERHHVHMDHEVGMYVSGRRDKNNQPTIVPLWKFENAEPIMREFEDPNPNSKYWFRRDIFKDVQVYNRNVKVVASRAGVHRKVSNKVARHTGWNLMLRMGVTWPVAKKIAGHKVEGIAGKHYVRIGLSEVIDGTKLADFDRLGI